MFRRLSRLAFPALAAGVMCGCRENLSEPSSPGPDSQGPTIQLVPGSDTTVTGSTLNILVTARDRSRVQTLWFYVVGGNFGYPPVQANDTVLTVGYAVPLSGFRNASFGFYARATDLLGNETVTGTVTVLVR
ncbi:MAG TPA: hypothetical protein VNL98_05270 [Gemmatimonadales bacterium]|nr:hypothetical protein [Gemmatimonadales bacterium]